MSQEFGTLVLIAESAVERLERTDLSSVGSVDVRGLPCGFQVREGNVGTAGAHVLSVRARLRGYLAVRMSRRLLSPHIS
jgi:hypothetical protein